VEQSAEKIKQISELLAECRYTVALTGAGVSTESGIPDFRSPDSGLWTRVNPELFTLHGFKADPAQFYNLGREFFQMVREAEPNVTHTVLGELQQRGFIQSIITQNVDGLHQRGGAQRVLEIHGSMRTASCIFCQHQEPIETVISEVEEGLIPPLCIECGEPLKPDVILFGEALPPSFQEAMDEARQADCIIVIGSSMQVSPANMLPGLSKNLIIINREPTFYDSQARVVLHGNTSQAMQLIMDEINASY
jgi:NAD-dependent deacetylase